ncbi:hypothetical protein N7E02_20155 [Aliirhizobium terrae]|uniref:hypothetical protein n=1 Tax=Terrirhizobium terrae TaxID=2926709 RepID=UPI002575B01E|nr:hypothetical protein [Rhizobium sp. CC-CFT758]WJH39179.1 hypothetical protein N7E02_20155 [Rhizobium sp. CC-CFT758]
MKATMSDGASPATSGRNPGETMSVEGETAGGHRDWEDYFADPTIEGRVLSDHALIFRYEACARYLKKDGDLDLYVQGRRNLLDYEPFQFGRLYRCIRNVKANRTDRISGEFAEAHVGDTMWFTGWSSHAYDGLAALFFCDLQAAREFVFSDACPEIDGRINRAFKAAPEDYFQVMEDNSEYGDALMALRGEIMSRRHALPPSKRCYGLLD